MTPKSLLRHIFRHGTHAKPQTKAPPSDASTDFLLANPAPEANDEAPALLRSTQPMNPDKASLPEERPAVHTDDIVLAPPTTTSQPNTPSQPIHDTLPIQSIANVFATLDYNVSDYNYTTHDLIHAMLDEAAIATSLHLDTIKTTLELLDTLEHFSPTVAVLREEMVQKKRVCEETLKTLEGVEAAVMERRFDTGERGMEVCARRRSL
ncbi:Nn.00g090760.m01.CDS01 [Neocucurbitaria sp. VM-36]